MKNLRIESLLIMIALSGLIWLSSCSREKTEQQQDQSAVKINPQKLAGRWLRPDGGYVLQLKNIRDDGTLDASYYNPKSINVADSRWRWKDSHLQVYVKFDDVNYPGSTYNLEYFPAQDGLIGNYYQATLGQNYTIEFIRQE